MVHSDDATLDDDDELLEPSPEAKMAAAAANEKSKLAERSAEERQVVEEEAISATDPDGDAAWKEASARKAQRVAGTTAEPAAEAAAEPAAEAAAEPAIEPEIEPVVESVAEPVTEPASEESTHPENTDAAALSEDKATASTASDAATKGVETASTPPQSKLAQSKVVEAGHGQGVKPALATPETPTPSESVAASRKYTTADLEADLAIIQVTAQMGLVAKMLDGLANVTFGLGDADEDGSLTPEEAVTFATNHLKEKEPLGQLLGLSGGVLPLDNVPAVRGIVDQVFEVCDADKDGKITREEARAEKCMRVVLGLLEAIPEPVAQAPQKQGAASAFGSKGSPDGLSEIEELMAQAMGMSGKKVSGSKNSAPGRSSRLGPIAEAMVPLNRFGRKMLAQARANLAKPNLNTALTGTGVGCLVLRELLRHDLFQLREALRGVIGGPLPEFLGRLRNLALAAIAAGALFKFD